MIALLLAAAAASASTPQAARGPAEPPAPQAGTCTLLIGDEDVGCRRIALTRPTSRGPTRLIVVDGGQPLGFSGPYSPFAMPWRGTMQVDTMLSGANTATAEGSCRLEFAYDPNVLAAAECESFSAYGQVRLTFTGAARR